MTTRADSGRKGGLVTLERYGKERLREWGRLGGRPRSPTYDDITAARLLEDRNNTHKQKEVIQGPPDNQKQLKERYKHKLRRRSNGIPETVQAGTAQETTREASLPERKAV